MRNPLTWLSKRRFPYEPLIKVEISRSRLLHNLNQFRKIAPGGNIAPVLKANAYGHGLLEVAKILEESREARPPGKLSRGEDSRNQNQIPFFVIDSYFEAIALRSSGIKTPLLIIGYTRPETISSSRLRNVSFTISNIQTLLEARPPGKIKIHLKIDTGMNRQGILIEEIPEAIEFLKKNKNIELQGIMSHLSDADNTDVVFTKKQIEKWHRVIEQFKSAFPDIKYIHLSNTDGHRFSGEIEANVSRLGIGLYGLIDDSSFQSSLNLQPIMEMKTIVTGIKKLNVGESVGYGNTFTAQKDMTIATIPVGYFEGVDRRLSNNGSFLVGRDRITCPIIGRVSMNITTVDVSSVMNLDLGAPVTVISNNSRDPNSILEIAKRCQTITYEISVHVGTQLKRVIFD